jgi:uncharacterized protein
MKNQYRILLISLLMLATPFSFADELTPEKKQRIDILLEKTGAARLGQLISNQFIRIASTSLQRSNPKVDPKAFNYISEEVNKVVSEEINDKNAVKEMIYPIYNKHLTLNEVNDIIAFYETPLGKKILTTMPLITREGMAAARTWGQSLAPKIQQRLEARFLKEGIKFR